MNKIKSFIIAHKIISAIVAIIILYAGYRTYRAFTSTTGETRYVVAAVQKGTIVSAVTGSGQVSASNQIDVKSKVSGTISYIIPANGQSIQAGTVIAKVDSSDAGISLQNAEISFQKLTEPADASTLLQSQNAVTKAGDDVVTSYGSALSAISSSFVDMPSAIGDLNSQLNGSTGILNSYSSAYTTNTIASNYRTTAVLELSQIQIEFSNNLADYKALNAQSASSTVESVLNETYTTAKNLAQALKDAKNTVDFLEASGNVSSTNQALMSSQTTINNWLSKINDDVGSLSNAINGIQDAKNTLLQDQESLAKLQSGPDPLDIEQQKLAVEQQQIAYSDYTITAPIDGILAAVDLNVANDVSSGTTVATVITKEKQAVISLNEIDAAKVAVGQNATLTFDAIDGLSIAGKVSQVDYIGTVTQGVVTYSVKITFDTDDARVKPGMSVNTSIATNVAQDVLVVPSTAIKTQGTTSYVQTVDSSVPVSTSNQGDLLATPPEQTQVQVGISDDTSTEIVSGLSEGQKIITRTVAPSTATTASAPSIFNAAGVRGGATGGATGGAARGGAAVGR